MGVIIRWWVRLDLVCQITSYFDIHGCRLGRFPLGQMHQDLVFKSLLQSRGSTHPRLCRFAVCEFMRCFIGFMVPLPPACVLLIGSGCGSSPTGLPAMFTSTLLHSGCSVGLGRPLHTHAIDYPLVLIFLVRLSAMQASSALIYHICVPQRIQV